MRYDSRKRHENKKIACERITILNKEINEIDEDRMKKRYKDMIMKLSKKYRVEICQKCHNLKVNCKCKDF